jgi:hypothetical protein
MSDTFIGRFRNELDSLIASERGRQQQFVEAINRNSFEALSDVGSMNRLGDIVGALAAYQTVRNSIHGATKLKDVEDAVRDVSGLLQGGGMNPQVRDGMLRGYKTVLTVARRHDRIMSAVYI